MSNTVFVYNPSAFDAIIISEVEVDGDYVIACYSKVTNDGVKETTPRKYKLYCTLKENRSFFNFRGIRYHIDEFMRREC